MSRWKKIKSTFPFLWKRRKVFGITLLIDIVTWLVLGSLFWKINRFLVEKSRGLLEGKTSEQITADLLQLGPQYAQGFQQDLRSFVIFLLALSVLCIILGLVAIAFKNSIIWSIIEHKKWSRKHLWRWLGAAVFTPLIFVVFYVIFLLIRLVLSLITQPFSLRLAMLMGPISLLIAGSAFFMFLSLWFLFFTRRSRVFTSLAQCFKWFYRNKGLSLAAFGLVAVTFFILQLIIVLILGPDGVYTKVAVNAILNVVIWVLLVAWMRFIVAGLAGQE